MPARPWQRLPLGDDVDRQMRPVLWIAAVFARSFAVLLLSSLSSNVGARPPSPPVRLMLGVEQANEVILPGDSVPIRLVARQTDVVEIVVTATLARAERATPGGAQSAQPFFERKFDAPTATTFDIPIALERGQQATLDVRMTGKLEHGGGFSDRLLRSLRRDANGRLVLSRVVSTDAQRQVSGNR